MHGFPSKNKYTYMLIIINFIDIMSIIYGYTCVLQIIIPIFEPKPWDIRIILS
jgi:hypothetical protein